MSAERSAAKRAQLRKLHGEGLSASVIARELGVSKSTVSRWAKADGIKFDRARTAEAVAAKSFDLAAGRQCLAEKMRAVCDNINKPYRVYSFGGRDNVYNEKILNSAPVEVRRNVITTAAITFDKLSRVWRAVCGAVARGRHSCCGRGSTFS